MVSERHMVLIDSEKREPVGLLTDYCVGMFSNFADWNSLSKFYGVSTPIYIIRQYHHRIVWSTLLAARKYFREHPT